VALGLSSALLEAVVYEGGVPKARNFDGYPILPPDRMPRVHVRIVESGAPMGGIGEPGLPGVPPAVANAVAALTGQAMLYRGKDGWPCHRLDLLPLQPRVFGQTAGWIVRGRIRGIWRGTCHRKNAANAPTSSTRRRVDVASCQADRDPRHLEERCRTAAWVRRGRGLRPAHRGRLGDLPERFGKPNSLYRRYRRWAVAEIWDELFTVGGAGSTRVAG
jgi:hypothetical protein